MEPDGKTTANYYQDGARYVTTTSGLDSGRNLFSVKRHDQIGWVWLEQTSEDGTDPGPNTSAALKVVHRYVNQGFRYELHQINPFRGGSRLYLRTGALDPTSHSCALHG